MEAAVLAAARGRRCGVGASCAECWSITGTRVRGVGAGLALPFADTGAMQLHLEEISRTVARRSHAVLLLDRAGWHTTRNLSVPKNITLIFLPSRAPELNPVEQIWQYIRGNWLSNRVFDTYDEIIDAACDAWNRLIAEPNTLTAIGMRQWAHTGHL
jgi:DDE superfamily endonuclease